jgi:hypothetical protein
MSLFVLLFSLALAAKDSYTEIFQNLKQKIAKLHLLTKHATFYEFFNLSENCSDSEIKKAFKRLKKTKNTDNETNNLNLKKDQFDELVMSGYSLLVNYRKAYDNFLRDSKYLYIDEKINFKTFRIVLLISSLFFLILVDGLIYGLKYLKYYELESNTKNIKKNNIKGSVSAKGSSSSSSDKNISVDGSASVKASSVDGKKIVRPPQMVTSKLYHGALLFFTKRVDLIKKKI